MNTPISKAALALSILLGLLVGVGGFTFYYARGASYLFDDPKVCVNCHVMRDHHDGWQKSSHHAVATCNDCHVPHALVRKYLAKAENGFWHSKGFTLQDFHEPIQIRTKNERALEENCVRCHGEFVGDVIAHYGQRFGEMSCVRCHDGVGHGAPEA